MEGSHVPHENSRHRVEIRNDAPQCRKPPKEGSMSILCSFAPSRWHRPRGHDLTVMAFEIASEIQQTRAGRRSARIMASRSLAQLSLLKGDDRAVLPRHGLHDLPCGISASVVEHEDSIAGHLAQNNAEAFSEARRYRGIRFLCSRRASSIGLWRSVRFWSFVRGPCFERVTTI